MLENQKHAFDVHGEHFIAVAIAPAGRRRNAGSLRAGAIENEVKTAKPRPDVLEERHDLGFATDVGPDELRGTRTGAQLVSCTFAPFYIPRCKHHVHTASA